jgi:hypothetical protein
MFLEIYSHDHIHRMFSAERTILQPILGYLILTDQMNGNVVLFLIPGRPNWVLVSFILYHSVTLLCYSDCLRCSTAHQMMSADEPTPTNLAISDKHGSTRPQADYRVSGELG